jgi:membrane fusion protein, adhesin transport system
MSLASLDQDFGDKMRGPSRVIWLIAATFALFIAWAAVAWVDEIVHAPGSVVSSSRPQIIQNLEGGILAELLVAEGDTVEAGQTLARLYGTEYQSAVDQLGAEIAALETRRLRLEAEMAGMDAFDVPEDISARVPAIVASERAVLKARRSEFTARVDGQRAVLEQAAQERDLLEKMYERDVAPLIEVTRARKAYSDAESRLNEAITTTELDRAADYSKTQNELASLRQKLALAQDKLRRTVLVAPMRGVVNKLSVTTIGGVVRSGEEILQIIPLDEDLMVEAKVNPRDIAAVRQGQEAVIKLTAYDSTIFGTLTGRVSFVSADTFKDERSSAPDGNPHYKVMLQVDRTQLTGRLEHVDLRPGMQADVELQTGGKTVLTYLTKPLYKSSEAFRER